MATDLILTSPHPRALTPMDLLQQAIDKADKIDPQVALTIIKDLKAMQNEEREYQARVAFDNALNACQAQIGRIKPNVHRENNIWWADYAQIDRAVRPIYTPEGFSIAFSEDDSHTPGKLRMKATLSRCGISKEYFAEITQTPANTRMSQVDADAGAASRVKRYLLLDIFNIAIGIDKDEKKPFEGSAGEMDEAAVRDYLSGIEAASNHDELQRDYFKARDAAAAANDTKATEAFANAKNKRLVQLNKAQRSNHA